MGMVNWALKLLYKITPKEEIEESMQTKGVSVRGYQGGGLDGVNSNRFLKHLDFLSTCVPPSASPIFQTLAKFKVVVESCFGIDLNPTYKEDIDEFNNEILSLITYCDNELGIIWKPTWKIHILVAHLKPFLEIKQVGLGIFCEQTSEAAHCVLKPTLQRLKRKADHRLHGMRLLRAVSDFSSKNM